MSKKDNLRFETLREAMAEVQNSRSSEVGGHTWQQMVERYGEAILFAEVASIVGRLESLLWDPQTAHPDANIDRLLDLCIDLGNYAEFLYLSFLEREKRAQGPGEKMPIGFVFGGVHHRSGFSEVDAELRERQLPDC